MQEMNLLSAIHTKKALLMLSWAQMMSINRYHSCLRYHTQFTFYIGFVYYECKIQFVNIDPVGQKGIYVANEYPNYVRNRLNVNENLRFWAKLSWIEGKSVNFDGKQANSTIKHINFSIFEHPTVGSQKFNTLHVLYGPLNTPLGHQVFIKLSIIDRNSRSAKINSCHIPSNSMWWK